MTIERRYKYNYRTCIVSLFSKAKRNDKSLNIYENHQIIISWEIEK